MQSLNDLAARHAILSSEGLEVFQDCLPFFFRELLGETVPRGALPEPARVEVLPPFPAVLNRGWQLVERRDIRTDVHRIIAVSCPSPNDRPLIGVQIVLGMKPAGTDKWSGQVYNAEDGKTYSGNLTFSGGSSLVLQGCALGGLVCKGQTWTKAN